MLIESNLDSSKYTEMSINHEIELYSVCDVKDNRYLDDEVRSDYLRVYCLNGEDVSNLRKLTEFLLRINL